MCYFYAITVVIIATVINAIVIIVTAISWGVQ